MTDKELIKKLKQVSAERELLGLLIRIRISVFAKKFKLAAVRLTTRRAIA